MLVNRKTEIVSYTLLKKSLLTTVTNWVVYSLCFLVIVEHIWLCLRSHWKTQNSHRFQALEKTQFSTSVVVSVQSPELTNWLDSFWLGKEEKYFMLKIFFTWLFDFHYLLTHKSPPSAVKLLRLPSILFKSVRELILLRAVFCRHTLLPKNPSDLIPIRFHQHFVPKTIHIGWFNCQLHSWNH